MNYRGFRPPFRGPGPRFMGGGRPPRPPFFNGPPRPHIFHGGRRGGPPGFNNFPRNGPPCFGEFPPEARHDDFFNGPVGYFDDFPTGNGPPPQYVDPRGGEFPAYFDPEMQQPDVVMRDPYGDDFPPPPPLRRGPPPRSGWKREDRILRNPHPQSPKSGPPKVNKVQPLVDIVNTPPAIIPTPVADNVPQSAGISASVEVETSPSTLSNLTSPLTILPTNLAPAQLMKAVPQASILSKFAPASKLTSTTSTPQPTVTASATTTMTTTESPKLTTLPATMTPSKKDEPLPTPAKAVESKPHPVVSGIVTQMLDSSGVVDGKIFFDASTMVGPMPSVGDAVVVEVECVTGLPFELIGRRVQILATIEQVLKSRDEMNPPPKNEAALEEEYAKFLKESNLANTTSSGSDDCDNVGTPATPKIKVVKTPEEEAEFKRLRTFRAHLAKKHKMLQRNLENADRLKSGLAPLPKYGKRRNKGRKRVERGRLFKLLKNKFQKTLVFKGTLPTTGCPIPVLGQK